MKGREQLEKGNTPLFQRDPSILWAGKKKRHLEKRGKGRGGRGDPALNARPKVLNLGWKGIPRGLD